MKKFVIGFAASSLLTGVAIAQQQRDAAAFMSRAVALHFQKQGVLDLLAIEVPIELPPVGLISLRGRRCTPSTERLIDCLRRTAAKLRQRKPRDAGR